jgi:4-amino-4-deoxy-L-arabinose transferase-like glycosyltransferase
MSRVVNAKLDVVLVLVIFFTALFIRLLFLADYKDNSGFRPMQYSDSHSYFLWAKDIETSDMLGSKVFMKWPFYAYFLGFLFRAFGENIFFVYLIQFVLGSISSTLVYFITKRIFNRACAFIAAMLYVSYGPPIFYEGRLIYVSLSIFLDLLFLLFLLCKQRHLSKINLFLCGIFLGICVITQGNILIFGILSIFWLLWLEQPRLQAILNKFIYFLFGLSLIIGAVTLRNYIVEKDFVLIVGNIGVNFYIGNNPEANGRFFCPRFFKSSQEGIFRDSRIMAEVEAGKNLKASQVSGFWFKKSLEFIKKNPLAYFVLLGKKFIYLFSPDEFIHDNDYFSSGNIPRVFKILFMDLRFILPLCILGLIINLKNFKQTGLLYFFLITLSFSIIMFFVVTRYRVAIVPVMAIFASSAIMAMWDAVLKKKIIKISAFLLILILLSLYFIFIGKTAYPGHNYSFRNYSSNINDAVYYIYKGEYNNAVKKLNAIQPPTDYSIFCLGIVAYYSKDFETAETRFKESIGLNPYLIDAYYNLGIIYNRQNRFAEAKKMLERFVSMDPDNYSGHIVLAQSYKGLGEFEKAREELGLALKKINHWRTKERRKIEKELLKLGGS